MSFRKLPDQAFLHERLNYNPETGTFLWKKMIHSSRVGLLGKIAGTKRTTGYIFIGLSSWGILAAHRLAWVYVHGNVLNEQEEIDHKDGNPSNNAIANLRIASSSEQKRNKAVQSNNRSGLKGAYFHAAHKGKKWRSQIRVDGKYIFLGYFHTADEAHQAYVIAATHHYGEFATFRNRFEQIRAGIAL